MMRDFTRSSFENDPHKISHFFHTETYKKNNFFKKYSDAFALHIYIHAFEITNPLGSHTLIHKMEALYMILQNFPAEAQSILSSAFLIALWHTRDVKTYQGYDKMLSPLIHDLKVLESDSGMEVTVRHQTVVVRAAVVLISADNLGFNSLLGFAEGFTAKKFRRFCECMRDETESRYLETDFRMHTVESYKDCFVHVGDPS